MVAPRGDPSIRNASPGALNKVGGVLRISRYARILLSIYLSLLIVVAPGVIFKCCGPILESHNCGFKNTDCIMIRLKFETTTTCDVRWRDTMTRAQTSIALTGPLGGAGSATLAGESVDLLMDKEMARVIRKFSL